MLEYVNPYTGEAYTPQQVFAPAAGTPEHSMFFAGGVPPSCPAMRWDGEAEAFVDAPGEGRTPLTVRRKAPEPELA